MKCNANFSKRSFWNIWPFLCFLKDLWPKNHVLIFYWLIALKSFMGTQETIIYRLVMRNHDFDTFLKKVLISNQSLSQINVFKTLWFENPSPKDKSDFQILYLRILYSTVITSIGDSFLKLGSVTGQRSAVLNLLLLCRLSRNSWYVGSPGVYVLYYILLSNMSIWNMDNVEQQCCHICKSLKDFL